MKFLQGDIWNKSNIVTMTLIEMLHSRVLRLKLPKDLFDNNCSNLTQKSSTRQYNSVISFFISLFEIVASKRLPKNILIIFTILLSIEVAFSALPKLKKDSELIYVGDAGNTTAGLPARREGVEWSQHVRWSRDTALDANLAWTRPRFSNVESAVSYIPNAVSKVASLQMSWQGWNDWSGAWRVRPGHSATAVPCAASAAVRFRVV